MQSNDWLYGPSVYWFWSHIPSLEEIERQVGELAAAGYRSFLIQARLSLPRELFLSPDYLAAYRQAVEAARRHDLVVGIYDDYNWMSGHAGGRTVAADPSLRERHLFWSTGAIVGRQGRCAVSEIHSLMYEGFSEAAMRWAYEDGRIVWGDWQVFKVLAYRDDPQQFRDVTSFASLAGGPGGCEISLALPDEDLNGWRFTAWVHGQCISSRMINYLDPSAGKVYVQVGLEPYRQAVGDDFGGTVRYLFFDHPYCGFYIWKEHTGAIGNSLMFSPALPAAFERRCGYPLEQALMAFIAPAGPAAAPRRCDFFETYGELGRENFFAELRAWSERNALLLTGHELLGFVGSWGITGGFASLDVRTNFGGDYFAIDRFKDLSAVDACNYHPQISTAFGASAGKANGKSHCLIEQYVVASEEGVSSAAGDWGLSLSEVRRQAIRHLLQGAGNFIFHAYYLSDGDPQPATPLGNIRFDFPPGINYEPWFEHHPAFAEEIHRLSAFVQHAKGGAPNPVAVLYSRRTYWSLDDPGPWSAQAGGWFELLTRHGIEFDIIDERQLEQETLPFGWLILPSVSVLPSSATLACLTRFLARGGQIITSGEQIAAAHAGGPFAEDDLRAFYAHPNHRLLASPGEITGELIEAIRRTGGRPYLTHGEQVWFWSAAGAGEETIILFNDAEQPQRARFACAPDRTVACWDANLSEKSPYLFFDRAGDRTVVTADLRPGEVRVFSLNGANAAGGPALADCSLFVSALSLPSGALRLSVLPNAERAVEITLRADREPVTATGEQVHTFTVEPLDDHRWGVRAVLDESAQDRPLPGRWRLEAGGQTWTDLPALDRSWEDLGLEGYKGPGRYTTAITLDPGAERSAWALALPDYAEPFTLRVNGESVGEVVIDARQAIIPRGMLRQGSNTIEIRTQNSADAYYYAGTPFAKLIRRNSGRIGRVILSPVVTLEITFRDSTKEGSR